MKLLKILFALMILCNLQGCAMLGDFRSAISRWHLDEKCSRLVNHLFFSNVQGTYYLNTSFSKIYYDDSMKVILDTCNKGCLVISDTMRCYFNYDPNFKEDMAGTRTVKLIFDEKDSLGFQSEGFLIRNHLQLKAPDLRPIYFTKSRH